MTILNWRVTTLDIEWECPWLYAAAKVFVWNAWGNMQLKLAQDATSEQGQRLMK